MIVEQPTWSFATSAPLTKWYGHVSLLNERVLGQWVCLRRSDGALLWQRRFRRANTIVSVVDDVIVASETRSDGPWTIDFGCYGICLHTGHMLWVSHGIGLRGALGRLLDYVPGFTNDLRDAPAAVDRACVYCRSGRVLDIRSGRMLYRVRDSEIPTSSHWAFRRRINSLNSLSVRGEFQTSPLRAAEDLFLTRVPPQALEPQTGTPDRYDNVSLYAIASDRSLRWQFRASELGYFGDVIPFALCHPFVYVVVSDSPPTVPIQHNQPLVVRPNPGTWHALTLDVTTGSVLQDIVLGHSDNGARIEDADDRGVLFSLGQHRLLYLRRRDS